MLQIKARTYVLTSISREPLHPFISMLSAACVPQRLPTHTLHTTKQQCRHSHYFLSSFQSKFMCAVNSFQSDLTKLNRSYERRYCFFILFSSCALQIATHKTRLRCAHALTGLYGEIDVSFVLFEFASWRFFLRLLWKHFSRETIIFSYMGVPD